MTRCVAASALLVPLAMLGGAAAAEAQGNVSIAVEQYVLPGHMAAWEEAVKEHNEWHRDQNDPWQWIMYQAVSGDLSKFIIITPGHTWADLDNPPVDPGEDEADAMARIGPHASGARMGIGEVLADVSMPPPPDQLIQMAQVTDFRVKPGKDAQFLNVLSMFHAAAQQVGGDLNFLWIANRSGDLGMYTLAVPMEGLSELGAPGAPMEVMTAAYGPVQAQALADDCWNAVESSEENMYVMRPDLSYLPGN